MDIFKAISDPRRRKILEVISNNKQISSTEISHRFRISPSAVSQHLKVLKQAGLIEVQKNAQMRIYSISNSTFKELINWIYSIAYIPSTKVQKKVTNEHTKLKQAQKIDL